MSQTVGGKVFVFVAVIVIAIMGFFAYRMNASAAREYKKLQSQREEVTQEIKAKNLQLAELIENQNRFREDREFVAHLARQEHYTCPGEIVYKFPIPEE